MSLLRADLGLTRDSYYAATAPRDAALAALQGETRADVAVVGGGLGHGLALTGLAGKLVAEAMDGDASRFDIFARLEHRAFPGGRLWRTPTLVLGMAYHRLKEAL